MKYDNMNIVLYGAGAQNVRRVCRAAASIGLNIIKIVDKDIQE